MSSKNEQKLRQNIILASFDAVGKIDYMRNKWIILDVWIKMIRRHCTLSNRSWSEIVSNLSNTAIKNIFTKASIFNVNNNSVANPNGYYLVKKRLSKRKQNEGGEGNAQNVSTELQAVMVIDKGLLLPLSNQSWHRNLITALPPQATVPTATTSPSISTATTSPSSIPTATTSPVPTATTSPVPTASLPRTTQTITPPRQQLQPAIPIECTDYFLSSEARKFYGYMNPFNEEERNRPVEDIVIDRIKKFYNAAHSVDGWKELLEDEDVDNKMSQYEIF